jgi:hypothetical protein
MTKKIVIIVVLLFSVFGLFILPGKFNPLFLLLFVPILWLGIKEFRK